MGILLIGINLMVGCASFFGGDTPPSPSNLDNSPFEYALSTYQKGDYAQAAMLFNNLSEFDTNENQYLKAQLGSICCQLILAGSPEDVSTARKMWQDLSAGDHWQVERILFDPLIDRLSFSAEKPAQQVVSATTVTTKEQPKNELAALKKKVAKVTKLQRQLDAVLAENQILKQKIKALETIDQNIQKKKTEISAPSD
jgi:hypothetical protein